MKEFLKNTYGFSNYQIAQLGYLGKTILAEISKLLIMGFIFRNELDVYFIAIITLLLLRTSTGGLHCKTFLTCLLSSFLYMFTCIKILPVLLLPPLIQVFLLLICMIINYKFGPITSDIHMPLTEENKQKGRIRALVIISSFLIFSCIMPENKYIPVCFWIIIVHSLQFIYAKIRKKGE